MIAPRKEVKKWLGFWRRYYGSEPRDTPGVMAYLRSWEVYSSAVCFATFAVVALYHWRDHLGGSLDPALMWTSVSDAVLSSVSNGAIVDFSDGEQHGYLLWSTLYYLRFSYALCAFPYLVTLLPGVAQIIIRSRATGYNEHGMLVPALTNDELGDRFTIEQEKQQAGGFGEKEDELLRRGQQKRKAARASMRAASSMV